MKYYLSKLLCLLSNVKMPLISYEGLVKESKVTGILRSGQWVAMLYLDIMDFELTEQICGSLQCKQVLRILSNIVHHYAPGYLAPYRFLESRHWGDDMVIYFNSNKMPPPSPLELSHLADRMRGKIALHLNEGCQHLLHSPFNFHAGYTLLNPATQNIEKVLYNGFKEAMLLAKGHLSAREIDLRRQFSELLLKKNIRIVYQPIVSLETGEIMGYEALTRGPKDSFFANPVNLFCFAEKINQSYALEKIAREKAMVNIAPNLGGKKLFLNISPGVIHDPSFRADGIKNFLAGLGATPDQVVFEITERTSIEDFNAFRKSLGYYRHHGFQVAVDDAGSGYSSLQAISELQPDYIKIDLSLISDIDKTPNKQVLVETFLTFSGKTGSRIIAEGIEKEQELACLRKLGVPLAQGFLLARPAYPPPGLAPRASQLLSSRFPVIYPRERRGKTLPVSSICQETTTFTPSTITREVVDFFTRYPQVEGVAILDKGKPVGLVMRDKLFNQLGTQYGFAIYTSRQISLIMDKSPLVMEYDTPVEVVSQAALGRSDHRIYDSIIISYKHQYTGIISVRSLLNTITGMQVEAARFANPLTGLPGNRQIDEELLSRLASNQPFSVIYADLDHFKGLNDSYGFERGDLVIKLTANIIKENSLRLGMHDDLVGHIGGDDFIVVTRPKAAENISRQIISDFDSRVPELYDQEDREKGYIETRDRQNQSIRLPIVSISLVIINCQPGQYQNCDELARATAELKKYAKSKAGSVFVKERRIREP